MAIELKNVTMRYGKTTALDNVSLRFEDGRIYGLLGPNGAGKTTMLNLITNRIYPASGEISIDGESVADNDNALRKAFLMSEGNLFPDDMNVLRGFKAAALLSKDFDMDEAKTLAEAFDLPLKSKITALSTGYASIFRLILALSCNTPYMLLDEPVLGLDAQNRDLFYRLLVEKCAESPRTVIFSTHLIEEAGRLIEHSVIIKDGRILRDSPAEELLRGAYSVSGPAGAVDAYAEGLNIMSTYSLGGLKTVCIEGEPEGEAPEGLEFSRMGIQDYFINLMNREGK